MDAEPSIPDLRKQIAECSAAITHFRAHGQDPAPVIAAQAMLEARLAGQSGDRKTAVARYDDAITGFTAADMDAEAATVALDLVRLHQGQGASGEALSACTRAVEAVEAVWSKTPMAGRATVPTIAVETFDLVIRSALSAGAEALAFGWMQRAKARWLNDMILLRQATPVLTSLSGVAGGQTDHFTDLWKGALQRLDEAWNAHLAGTLDDEGLRRIEGEVQVLFVQGGLAGPGPWQAHAATFEVGEIQARLRPQEALIEMFVDSEATHLAVIRPDRWHIASCPLAAAAVRDIAMMLYLNLIQNQSRYGFEWQTANITDDAQRQVADLLSGILYQDPLILLQELYDRLLAPLMDDLAGVTRLILCPHWVLHLVPFHAMGPAVADGDLVINRMALTYCPSATIWARLREPMPVAGSEDVGPALILGVEQSARGTWWERVGAFLNRLRGDAGISDFEAEAQDVAGIIGGRAIVGEAATKERLLAGLTTAGIVHLSCHSAGDRGHPCLNGLLLADGLLSVAEILTERRIAEVRAALISLSACRSGLDRLEPGDVFHGIGYALLSRCGTTLLTSLWPVDAEATHRLMVEVFRAYQGGSDWAEALRQAQLATRRARNRGDGLSFEDPYFWAGFFLLGD